MKRLENMVGRKNSLKFIFMLVNKMSRFSFFLFHFLVFLFSLVGFLSFGQQRENDFTKRVRSLDGKMNSMSSKRLFSDRLNKLSNKRFSVSEWPSRFSSF